jgi:PRTRC genetic system protein A
LIAIAGSATGLPYGVLQERFDYAFDNDVLEAIIDAFIRDAKLAMPNECAAWGVWNERAGLLEYRPLIADEASPGGVTFHRPRLQPHEHLAVDIHSHGALPAFFSDTDDDDDYGETKIATVVGTLDQEPTVSNRLCVLGHFVEFEDD